MSELLIEIFSEEMPAKLQSEARVNLKKEFKEFLDKENIKIKNDVFTFSTPNRLILLINDLSSSIKINSAEIKGPSILAPEIALNGFINSNKITKNNLYKKKTDKGEFYFYERKAIKKKTSEILNENIPKILSKLSWKKSMKWGDKDLYWGRPLKSILAIFDKKPLDFNFYHLKSSNQTFIEKDFEEKTKKFNSYKDYKSFFKNKKIILDNEQRKIFIEQNLVKLSKKKKLEIIIDNKLLNEVTDIVEKPNIIFCEFNKKFLDLPNEINKIMMEQHQKYFPTFDNKKNLTNKFFVVADCLDEKGFVKLGNERVVDARLSDAEFFWKKNKSQSMVKQVSKLKDINYFKGLGSYFDKIQRMKKLSGIISDELLISKEKIEIASMICKVDLMSDLVGEFPELQGTLGGYFAESQGFEKDVCLAIKEHYLPIGIDSKIPKKQYSIALSITDKLDTLVGFFGINLIPTSSRDPFGIRRLAIGLLKIILENNIKLKIKDLINYSCQLYNEQSLKFDVKNIQFELSNFFKERLKYFMREKKIRQDIIEASTTIYNTDDIVKTYKKAEILNSEIKKDVGVDVISNYKRAYKIISAEGKNKNIEVTGSVDVGIFNNEHEKNLYKKIHEIKKDFASISIENDYKALLRVLASSKNEVDNFFDNVIVNDQDNVIKKNRLELLKMFCLTFDSYFNFSKIESV